MGVTHTTGPGDLKAKNIQSFSSEEAVEAYSSVYIRSSEEYVIKKYMRHGSLVLDVGCGTGRTTEYIYKNKCDVVGIDLAEPLILKARELHPGIGFEVMDAAKLVFPDNAFDIVFFSFNGIDNFGTLVDRHTAMRELMRVVKPGGFFIYSSHNSIAVPRTWAKLFRLFRNFGTYKIGPHWRTWNYGFGTLFQYYNNIWNERRQIRELGFRLVETVANGKVSRLPRFLLPFLEKFPTYIIQK